MPKTPVAEAAVTEAGVAGDRQRDLLHHRGPDRAVSLYSLEVITALRREGHTIRAGTTGENLTLAGLDWDAVVPGAEIRIGPVRLQVAGYAVPCSNIAGSHAICVNDADAGDKALSEHTDLIHHLISSSQ